MKPLSDFHYNNFTIQYVLCSVYYNNSGNNFSKRNVLKDLNKILKRKRKKKKHYCIYNKRIANYLRHCTFVCTVCKKINDNNFEERNNIFSSV